MAISVRSVLMSGISVVGATAIAIAPVHAPPPETTAHTTAPVRVVSDEFVELLAAVQPAAATGDPVALNAAGDAVIDAWNRALPWLDYWVELAAYVVDFIPFGFELADQIYIFYFTLTRPILDSFVVDLVAPVVSEPLNINSYIDGLSALGSTTVNALWNFAITEFNYFFGWLIPPIPPLPPLQSAVEGPVMEPMMATSAATSEEEVTVPEGTEETNEAQTAGQTEETVPEGTEETGETGETTELEETTETEEATETEETETEETEEVEEIEEAGATTSTNGTVAAQGEVRGSIVDATDVTDETTDDTSSGGNQTEAGGTNDVEAPSDDAADTGDDGNGADAGDGGEG